MATITMTGPSGARMDMLLIPEVLAQGIDSASATALAWDWIDPTFGAFLIDITGTGLVPVVTDGFLTDLTGGTISAIVASATDLAVAASFADLDVSAAAFFDAVQTGQTAPLLAVLLAGDDAFSGTAFGDVLLGGDGNDTVSGNSGGDRVLGGRGADDLMGGKGRDVLIGGKGPDNFVFDLRPEAGGVDRIADFDHGVDQIVLVRSKFDNLGGLGSLAETHFQSGAAATTALHGIVYDATTGNIYSDADGSGGLAAVLFARVDPGTVLTAADFVVI